MALVVAAVVVMRAAAPPPLYFRYLLRWTTSSDSSFQAENDASDAMQSATTKVFEDPASITNVPEPSASNEEEQSTPIFSDGSNAVSTVTSAVAITPVTQSCSNHTSWEIVTVLVVSHF
jgi:hypothetical protein